MEEEIVSLLNSVKKITEKWIDVSLQVRDGRLTGEQAVKEFDNYMVPVALTVALGIDMGIIK